MAYTESVRNWWAVNVDTEWENYRNKAMDLLKRDDELERMVKLIGADALSDNQKLVLHVVELIKDGFLNQNAFDKIDTFTTPTKQFKMLKLIIDFYELSSEILRAKIPIYLLDELPLIPKLKRMKSNIPNKALKEFDNLHDEMVKELKDLKAMGAV